MGYSSLAIGGTSVIIVVGVALETVKQLEAQMLMRHYKGFLNKGLGIMGMKLIMLGAPGAGKGTQAEILSAKLGIPTISTGNILRAAIKDGTPIGLQAKSYMDAGKLVPDEVIIGIVAERLAQPDCAGGFILDGVPRTIGQAEALDQAGVTFDHVLSIEISDAEIEERMEDAGSAPPAAHPTTFTPSPPKQEGICDSCGGVLMQRDDDRPETVRHRLEVYHSETEPLKGYYESKGILNPIPNQPTIEGPLRSSWRR